MDEPLEETALVGVGTCVIVPLDDNPLEVTDPITELEASEVPEEAELMMPDGDPPTPVERGYGGLKLENEAGREPEEADPIWIDEDPADPLGIG